MSDCWRTGASVALNVYRGDTPMFQCHTPEDAAEVVELLNLGAAWSSRTADELQTPEGLDALLETTKAGRDLLKDVSEERKLKTRVTDKFADYCIERNEHVVNTAKLEALLERAVIALDTTIDKNEVLLAIRAALSKRK